MSLMNLVNQKFPTGLDYTPNPIKIREERFSVANKGVLHTEGIITCIGLSIYDSELKEGLIAHIFEEGWGSSSKDYHKIIGFLTSICDLNNSAKYELGAYFYMANKQRIDNFVKFIPENLRNVLNVYQGIKVSEGVTLDLSNGNIIIGLNNL